MRDDVRKKIKNITIQTKRLMQSAITGDYLSAFKGTGLEFDQLREYSFGDDVRFIDWNSSAKMNKIMVKQFIEERDRTIILAIDVSASAQFSSNAELRAETMAHVAAALAYVATQNNDKVGAVFFSDRVEAWIEPRRGNAHYGKIVETIFSIKPTGTKTNFREALRFLISLKKRNAVLFVLSDWIEQVDAYSRLLKVAACKYDLIAVQFLDEREQAFPSFGLLSIQDPETGERLLLDTRRGKKDSLSSAQTVMQTHQCEQQRLCDKLSIDRLQLTVGQPFINPLIQFFHQRIRRQI